MSGYRKASSGAKTGSGSYTGDSTANRAIPHGLGKVPILVMITCISDPVVYVKQSNFNYGFDCVDAVSYAITASDGTNFYVGNAGSYQKSANLNTKSYQWIAVG
jgi:hypothetical protein